MQLTGFETGFFQQLAPCCLLCCLAQFLCTARQGPCADIGWFAAADQQDVLVFDDDNPDTDDRPCGIFAITHGKSPAKARASLLPAIIAWAAQPAECQAFPELTPSGHRAKVPTPSPSRFRAGRSNRPGAHSAYR